MADTTNPGSRQRPFRHAWALLAGVILAVSAGAIAQSRDAAARNDKPEVRVMTRNLYLGGDLALVLTATNAQEFIDAATAIFANVEATNFNERAQAIADEIAAAEPDLVGLQEVALWRSKYPSSGTFLANVSQDIPGFGTFTSKRGWVAVDAQVSGQAFRLVSAHLDPDISLVQTAQALEILAGPAATRLPMIFVCDCNSPADGSGTPTYASLVAAGMRDTWIAVRGTPGYTCCQNADLLNAQSLLDERLDIIWLRGDIAPVKARLVGDADRDRTDSGLWPSDHAGVFAKLRLGSAR